jgi:hypothetical protein
VGLIDTNVLPRLADAECSERVVAETAIERRSLPILLFSVPLFAAATSLTSFDYISEKTPYTRWGDWFPLLCAPLAIACLIAERAA